MERCAECGAPAEPYSCDELFQVLLGLDHARREPWGPLHGVSVSCYLLQHPGRLPADGGARARDLLRAYLEGGLDEVNQVVGRARRGNNHRVRGGSARRAGDGVPPQRGAPRSRFSVTLHEVAVDGSFPAAGFAERVRGWAAATLGEWGRGA
ncbi:DUF5946 family protein [Streptomyces sp. NPDC014733]|uniref:DUF5946 family protein n=1 Tax=Streptomyces sp. NPDC014733 TaxID=3364885 RepID=UPI0036FC12C7